jgi:hypothetical protein
MLMKLLGIISVGSFVTSTTDQILYIRQILDTIYRLQESL